MFFTYLNVYQDKYAHTIGKLEVLRFLIGPDREAKDQLPCALVGYLLWRCLRI